MDHRTEILVLAASESEAAQIANAVATADGVAPCALAVTGEEFAQALVSPPDMVLVDYGHDGAAVRTALECLKTAQLSIPVIVLSEPHGEEAAAECIKSGAHDYVLKGHANRLLEAIRQAREYHGAGSDLPDWDYYRKLIENAPIAMILHQMGQILYANPAAVRLFEAPNSEAMEGRTIHAYVHPMDRPAIEKRLRLLMQCTESQLSVIKADHRVVSESGTVTWVETVSVPFRLGARNIRLTMLLDMTARKRVELALRQREQHFRDIIGDLTCGVVVHSKRHGSNLCNREARSILGLSEAQILGQAPLPDGWTMRNEKGASTTPREWIDRVAISGWRTPSEVARITFPNQEANRWILGEAFPVHDVKQELTEIIWNFVDITEAQCNAEAVTVRLKYEAALADCFRELLTDAPDALHTAMRHLLDVSGVCRVYIFENFDDPQDGLCMRQTYEVCGEGVSPQIDFPMLQHIPYATSAPQWQINLPRGEPIRGIVDDLPEPERTILRSQDIISLLVLPIRVDDRWFGFIGFDDTQTRREWNDNDVRLLHTAADMIGAYIARKRSQDKLISLNERLRKSEAKYRELVQNARNVILRMDLQGRITFFNEFAQRFFGYSEEEILGKSPVGMIVAKTDSAGNDMAAVIADICRNPSAHADENTENITRDGQIVHVAWTNEAIYDEDGHVREILSVGVDITARVEAQAQQRILEEQLRQAQKMESVGRLAGGVAHDFSNILSAIIGYSELALLQLPANHPLRPMLQEIFKAGGRATQLTRQLLAFGRKQVLEMKPLALNDVLANIEKMILRLIGEDVTVVMNLSPDLGGITADATQIEQVVVNLAINARDAMPDGGQLTVSTENVVLDSAHARQIPEIEPGPYVRLTVCDTGEGMDAITLNHIFEPFYTTKGPGKGTGLGLSMVYGIMRQHGGSILVSSRPGEGTRFQLYFPRSEHAPRSHAQPTAQAPTPSGKETLLVVEDEEDVREILCLALRQFGYTVIEATTPHEAISLFESGRHEIDMLLTDVIMPKMNGREVHRQLARTRPDLKVLYVSGYPQDVLSRRGILDPDVHLLSKPFSMQSLNDKIREVLEQA